MLEDEQFNQPAFDRSIGVGCHSQMDLEIHIDAALDTAQIPLNCLKIDAESGLIAHLGHIGHRNFLHFQRRWPAQMRTLLPSLKSGDWLMQL